MGVLDFFRQPDINGGVQDWLRTPGALLLDVRTPSEYRMGHIPGSVNLPLQQLDNVQEITDNEEVPIYVYCQSGARSRQAAALLERMGYRGIRNIGGIASYRGKVE
jgi:rhodanese-related sulfurtransferase